MRFHWTTFLLGIALVFTTVSTTVRAESDDRYEPYWIYKAIYDQNFELADERIELSKKFSHSGAQRAFFEGLMASMEWARRYDYKLAVTKLNQALHAGVPNAGSVLATLIKRISSDFCGEINRHGINTHLLLESLKANVDFDIAAFRHFVRIQTVCLGKDPTDPAIIENLNATGKNKVLFEGTMKLAQLSRHTIGNESDVDLFVEALSETYFDAKFGVPYSQWTLGLALSSLGRATDNQKMMEEGLVWFRLAILSGEYSEEDFSDVVGSENVEVSNDLLSSFIEDRAEYELFLTGVPFESFGCDESNALFFKCVAQSGIDSMYCWQPRRTGGNDSKYFELSEIAAYRNCRRHRISALLN